MFNRTIILTAVMGLLGSASWAFAAGDKNTKEVTVVGNGMSEEEAMRDAMRKALEEGAGTYISSQTQTKDFAIVKDTVLAKAAGFILSKEVLSKNKTDEGIWVIKMKAVVSIQRVVDTWGAVTVLLEQMGRPKIMIYLKETIDAKPQDDSAVQTVLENQLLKSGFVLVNKKQMDEIQRKEAEVAAAENKPDKLLQIAKKFGAQILITGSADAVLFQNKTVSGMEVSIYTAVAKVFCYRSDTGQSMATINKRATGNHRAPQMAANKSLELINLDHNEPDTGQMTRGLAPELTEDILNFWQEVLAGRGDAKFEISGIEFGDVEKVETELKKMKPVKAVNSGEFDNNIITFTLQLDCQAKDIAKDISKVIKQIKITSVSGNVIKAEWKKD
ncbi:MAG: hypothetical protein HZA50_05250 [Planctomycetes bacterium]|nr:hypothetical protein [Planctomycetota bacterium]